MPPLRPPAEIKVPLIFRGGHDTEGVDRGRPVILIAAALNVPPAVFREAFTHVKPAGPGQHPEEAQVRLNKQALMERLAPYGVTDDRLNEVSNYYRYRRDSGELWRHVDAAGFAMIKGGKVVSVTITNPGAGYSLAAHGFLAGRPDGLPCRRRVVRNRSRDQRIDFQNPMDAAGTERWVSPWWSREWLNRQMVNLRSRQSPPLTEWTRP